MRYERPVPRDRKRKLADDSDSIVRYLQRCYRPEEAFQHPEETAEAGTKEEQSRYRATIQAVQEYLERRVVAHRGNLYWQKWYQEMAVTAAGENDDDWNWKVPDEL